MSREAMKLALEALEVATTPLAKDRQEVLRAITALREALAEQPAQQALDKMAENARELGLDYEPAQRTWVGLTNEETGHWAADFLAGAKWAEAKLKEKNT